MSMTQTAYLASALVPTRAALQDAIDLLEFDLLLPQDFSFDAVDGFQPMELHRREAGVEMYRHGPAESFEAFPELVEAVGARDVAITFRWGGDMRDCACAMIVCAALATQFDAVVHSEDEDVIYDPATVRDTALAVLVAMREMEA